LKTLISSESEGQPFTSHTLKNL